MTGDASAAADAVGAEVGVDEVRARLLLAAAGRIQASNHAT